MTIPLQVLQRRQQLAREQSLQNSSGSGSISPSPISSSSLKKRPSYYLKLCFVLLFYVGLAWITYKCGFPAISPDRPKTEPIPNRGFPGLLEFVPLVTPTDIYFLSRYRRFVSSNVILETVFASLGTTLYLTAVLMIAFILLATSVAISDRAVDLLDDDTEETPLSILFTPQGLSFFLCVVKLELFGGSPVRAEKIVSAIKEERRHELQLMRQRQQDQELLHQQQFKRQSLDTILEVEPNPKSSSVTMNKVSKKKKPQHGKAPQITNKNASAKYPDHSRKTSTESLKSNVSHDHQIDDDNRISSPEEESPLDSSMSISVDDSLVLMEESLEADTQDVHPNLDLLDVEMEQEEQIEVVSDAESLPEYLSSSPVASSDSSISALLKTNLPSSRRSMNNDSPSVLGRIQQLELQLNEEDIQEVPSDDHTQQAEEEDLSTQRSFSSIWEFGKHFDLMRGLHSTTPSTSNNTSNSGTSRTATPSPIQSDRKAITPTVPPPGFGDVPTAIRAGGDVSRFANFFTRSRNSDEACNVVVTPPIESQQGLVTPPTSAAAIIKRRSISNNINNVNTGNRNVLPSPHTPTATGEAWRSKIQAQTASYQRAAKSPYGSSRPQQQQQQQNVYPSTQTTNWRNSGTPQIMYNNNNIQHRRMGSAVPMQQGPGYYGAASYSHGSNPAFSSLHTPQRAHSRPAQYQQQPYPSTMYSPNMMMMDASSQQSQQYYNNPYAPPSSYHPNYPGTGQGHSRRPNRRFSSTHGDNNSNNNNNAASAENGHSMQSTNQNQNHTHVDNVGVRYFDQQPQQQQTQTHR